MTRSHQVVISEKYCEKYKAGKGRGGVLLIMQVDRVLLREGETEQYGDWRDHTEGVTSALWPIERRASARALRQGAVQYTTTCMETYGLEQMELGIMVGGEG